MNRQMIIGLFVPILIWSIALASCEPNRSGVAVTARDSAGIEVVENGEVEGVQARWRLADRPSLRIGWRDDEPTFERVRSLDVLADGRIIVGDYGARMVYMISPKGEVEWSLGAVGEGPGEFRSVDDVTAKDPDTVLVQDDGNARITVLANGAAVETYPFRATHGRAGYYVDRLRNGSLYLLPFSLMAARDPEGWIQAEVFTVEPTLTVGDPVVEVPFVKSFGPENRNPFRHYGVAVTTGDWIAYARNDRPEVIWFDEQGEVVRISRWQAGSQELTDDIWEAYEAAARGRASRELPPERLEEMLSDQKRDVEGPLPLFSDVLGDDEGNVWLSAYAFPGSPSQFFFVLARDGTWLGEVQIPERFEPLTITQHRVVGVERDEWDVQAVAAYEIVKGG